MLNARKLGLVGRVMLWAGAILSAAGCNEGYMAGAAARGYGLRSGTAQGAAAGVVIGDYFTSEGNTTSGVEQAQAGRSQVIIINPQQGVVDEKYAAEVTQRVLREAREKREAEEKYAAEVTQRVLREARENRLRREAK